MSDQRDFQPHDPADWDAHNPLGPSSQALLLNMVPQQEQNYAQRAAENVAEWWADPAVQAWAAPFIDNPSRLIGAAISGENPFADRSAATYSTPLVSEALAERGVNPVLASLAELLVPDPTGAGKVGDLVPLLGALPFLRSLRRQPEKAAQLMERVTNPGGSSGMMEDLQQLFGAQARGQGVEMQVARGDGFARVEIDMLDDSTAKVDNLLSTFQEGGRGELRQLLPLLEVADAHGVTLVTTPEPFNHARTDLEGLYRMYSGAGFDVDPDNPTRMIRRPLPVGDAERELEAAQRIANVEQFLQRSDRGLADPGMSNSVDHFLRSQLGITLEDWVYGMERMGPDWGREMLEQTSLPSQYVDEIMTGVRLQAADPLLAAYQRVERSSQLTRGELTKLFTDSGFDEATAKNILERLGVPPELHQSMLADLGYTPPPAPPAASPTRPSIIFDSVNGPPLD